MALVLPSAELAAFIPNQWAAPAVWAGLAIALAATAGFFVVKRHSWLLAAPLSFGLALSVALALVNGWEAQLQSALTIAKATLTVASIAFFAAMVIVMARLFMRMNRHMRETTRDAAAQIADEGLFREDGERITVHVDRSRLLRRMLTQIVALSLSAGAFIWARSSDLVEPVKLWLSIGLGFVLCFGGLVALLNLTRLLMNSPTLAVNADGINDNGSLIVTGRGLLRWNEVLGVREYYIDLSDVPLRFRMSYSQLNGSLEIDLADFRAVRQRQPLWKRTLAIWAGGGQQTLGPRIFPALLDQPASELVNEINRYIHTHAPEGSWHKAMTDEEPEQLGED